MTQQQSREKQAREPADWMAASHVLEIGQKRAEALFEAQNELLIAFENLNRDWANRANAEAALASDATVKLMTARSIPDAANACQEWMTKRMDLWTQDSRWLLNDGQKFVQAGTRLLFNGAPSATT
jgi:hypothetical protein